MPERKIQRRIGIKRKWRDIAKQYGVSVRMDVKNAGKNKSASAGNDIYIGEYQNEELCCVSFFHELGHIVSPDKAYKKCTCRFDRELLAWKVGLRLAKRHGYVFRYQTLVWALLQLAAYYKWEEREMGQLYEFFGLAETYPRVG